LVAGVFSWIVAPWAAAGIAARAAGVDLVSILGASPRESLLWAYVFGVMWGVGGLTFGLSMRYLGMSLGYALALGYCAAFGTVIPPIFQGRFHDLLGGLSGRVTLGGVVLCLAGIAVCGRAGVMKERELSNEAKQAAIREFSFVKGIWVAALAGVMSACMAFAIAAGEPIGRLALSRGFDPLWQNTPVFIVILAGGFTTNALWCLFLNARNGTGADYLGCRPRRLLTNYILSATAGTTWYMQFMFYGMGKTQMGRFDFSSWSIHMAFIIVFSNVWGLALAEWRGVSRRTLRTIEAGILVPVFSTFVIGAGSYLQSRGW